MPLTLLEFPAWFYSAWLLTKSVSLLANGNKPYAQPTEGHPTPGNVSKTFALSGGYKGEAVKEQARPGVGSGGIFVMFHYYNVVANAG